MFYYAKPVLMKRLAILFSCLFFLPSIQYAQEYVRRTFKDTRVINTHTVETIQARKLDIRIGHRFGDLQGGWQSFYGLESAQDILMGADYGLSLIHI